MDFRSIWKRRYHHLLRLAFKVLLPLLARLGRFQRPAIKLLHESVIFAGCCWRTGTWLRQMLSPPGEVDPAVKRLICAPESPPQEEPHDR